MFNDLSNDILYEIFYFLPNEYIIENLYINKRIYNISLNRIFRKEIKVRRHPIVFNIFDNYCKICNFNKLGLYKSRIKTINCKHKLI